MTLAPAPEQPAPLTGGQINIAGILFQMLRALSQGIDLVAERARQGERWTILLTSEPQHGGDFMIETEAVSLVEQVKMRRGKANWSAGEVAEKVFPDLVMAVDATIPHRRFRFTTDRADGLASLTTFLAAIADITEDAPDRGLDDQERCFLYGRSWVSARTMFDRLAARSGIVTPSGRRTLFAMMRRLEVIVIDEPTMIAGIDAMLGTLCDATEQVRRDRLALIGSLMEASRTGLAVSTARLLEQVGLDPRRLHHIGWLRSSLSQRAQADAAALGYRSGEQARSAGVRPSAPLTVLSGISGQGKTWSLCEAALAAARKGHQVVLLPALGTVAAIEQEICRRLWTPSYDLALPLGALARRLAPALQNDDGVWLTLFLDDLHDRSLMQAILGAGWEALGIRLVIAAQPRIAEPVSLAGALPVAIEDFTPTELARHLRAAGRDPQLIPDDVLGLLARPVFAGIFVQLPDSADWQSPNEYKLVDAYWALTMRLRDQADHPSDGWRLADLAGTLFDDVPAYPWPIDRRLAAGVDDESVRRLLAVGLITTDGEGRMSFAHDRMLNWAVATWLARRSSSCSASDLHALFRRVDGIAADADPSLGRKLGYVLLDLMWLLVAARPADYVARFLIDHLRELDHHTSEGLFFRDSLATIGEPIIAVLEALLRLVAPEDEVGYWPRHVAKALVEVGQTRADQVVAACGRLIAAASEVERVVGWLTLARIPAPDLLDQLYPSLLKRARRVVAASSDDRLEAHRAKQLVQSAMICGLKRKAIWLDAAIPACDDALALEELVWLTLSIDGNEGRPLWQLHKAHIFAHVAADTICIARAIRTFRDADELPRLQGTNSTANQHMGVALTFDALVAVDPDRALAWLPAHGVEHLWGTSGWWLPGLVHRTGARGQAVLAASAQRHERGVSELTAFYGGEPDLLDPPTLDLLLDAFAERLDDPVEPGEDGLERQFRWLNVFAKIAMPDLLERIRARRGTFLETRLVRVATARPGRTSNYVDRVGDNARTLLAMIAGDGYDALALAELARTDVYGREDGLVTALWSESPRVSAALAALPIPLDERDYARVRRQFVLAVHGCDDALDEMLGHHDLVTRNSVQMRRARPSFDDQRFDALRERLRAGGDEAARAMRMMAYAGRADVGPTVVEALLGNAPGEELVSTGIGILDALGHYDPRLLPMLVRRLEAGTNADFVAVYLAWDGDANARRALVAWSQGRVGERINIQNMSMIEGLLAQPDSKAAAIDLLRRAFDTNLLGRTGHAVALLAEQGHPAAIKALETSAYERSDRWGGHPRDAIRYLHRAQPDEAFAAAERLFRRQDDVPAAHEMMRMDAERALPLLLAAYPASTTSMRWSIARLLRWRADPAALLTLLEREAAGRTTARIMAAELAGWLPGTVEVGSLSRLAEDVAPDVEKAALRSLRQRHREAGARWLIAHLDEGPKPLRWARLTAVLRLVDPHLLGAERDPLSLTAILDRWPAEFRYEVKPLIERAAKDLEDRAAKIDRDRERG